MNIDFDLKDLIEGYILDVGGIMFGDYVKDKITIETNINFFKKQKNVDQKKFYDPEYLPEFKDRLLMPKYMECIMSESQFKRFSEILQKDRMAIDDFNLINISENLTYKSSHIQFAVHKCFKPFFDNKIKVGFVLHKGDVRSTYPRSDDLDCKNLLIICGQLCFNDTSLSIHDRIIALNKTIADIRKRETQISASCQGSIKETLRIHGFCKSSDFRVKNSNFNMIYQNMEGNECYFCKKSTKDSLEVRRNCCNGCIHAYCIPKQKLEDDFLKCSCCSNIHTQNKTDSIFMQI